MAKDTSPGVPKRRDVRDIWPNEAQNFTPLQPIKGWAIDHLLRFKKVFGPRRSALVK